MAYSRKLAYEDTYFARLQIAMARLDRLREQARHLDTEHRQAAERSLDDLRGLFNRCRAKLEDVRRAEDDNWDMVRAHADQAMRTLIDAIDDHEMIAARKVA